MKLLSDRLLVEYTKREEKSAGGLYIPEDARRKPYEGKVVNAGPGYVTSDGVLQPMSVGVGDIVVFEIYAGVNTLTLEGKEYIIMREDDVLGVMEDK